MNKPRALLSVADKTGIVELGRGLAARGFTLVSTGGTARVLADAGLDVVNVSDVTGVPEMMDGRVKTLHPAIHGGILARRDRPDDLDALRRQGIGLIDLVVVNLYPFAEAARNASTTFDALVEEIDIGGPSLVRAAAKNFRHTLVVVDPADYDAVLEAIDGTPPLAFRFELARKAFAATAAFDAMVVAALATCRVDADSFSRASPEALPESRRLDLEKVRQLRYGENPHQSGSLWEAAGAPIGMSILQGKELSYTNLLDLDAAWRIVREFDEPAGVVVKHTNPCGAATGADAAEAYVRARDADPTSAFGGIVALNRPINIAAAHAIASTFIEAVIAPSVDEDARPVLAKKDKMRVLTLPLEERTDHLLATTDVRSVFSGLLMQQRDAVVEARRPWVADHLPEGFRVVTKRAPGPDEWTALRFAWRLCAHVKSNTIVFTDAQRTLAIGAGQMSRVDAVRVAVMKAPAGALAGSVAASDAFFPFRDGLDAVAAAGATAVIHPGGSVRDPEVIAAADEHGVAMVLTARRHFRH